MFIPTAMVEVSNAVKPTSTAMAAACMTCGNCFGQLISPTLLNATAGAVFGQVTTTNVYRGSDRNDCGGGNRNRGKSKKENSLRGGTEDGCEKNGKEKEMYPHLFSPLRIGNIRMKNRIIAAPTSPSMITTEGHFTPEMIAYLEEKAKGGVGVVTYGEAIVHSATRKIT